MGRGRKKKILQDIIIDKDAIIFNGKCCFCGKNHKINKKDILC